MKNVAHGNGEWEQQMASIEVDNEIYHVQDGNNLLDACLSLGLDLPYFCWHPAIGSVGSCRQCAVVQYNDRHDAEVGVLRDETGRIVMACMTPVSDGMRISIQSESAKKFRAQMIELLMTNHPHDCPVCEEGGECHLQDMTQMSGHVSRRYQGSKRTHSNQYLGPFINHEMNRCIACYRCVRFYQDYAGGHDLQAMASHNHVFFGRHESGILESEFSGNLVEVCPTGVFTDKTLSQHYARKWDLQAAPSVCVHCAQGCNISPGERYGTLRRVSNRYNSAVNGYFLCDRGRFGYEFVNWSDRVTQAVQIQSVGNNEKNQLQLSRPETRELLAQVIAPGKKLLGIGSPRASLEANYALRELVGNDNFYAGISRSNLELLHRVIQIYRSRPVKIPDIRDIELSDAVLVLGEDVMNTAPRMALSLRQSVRHAGFELADKLRIPRWQDAAVRTAAQQDKSPFYIASILPTRLDDVARKTFNATPDAIARLGHAIAQELDADAPQVSDLDETTRALAVEIASVLKNAKRPLVVSGLGCASQEVIQAAANVATALIKARRNHDNPAPVATHLVYCLPESNSMGLGLATLSGENGPLEAALTRIEGGDVDAVVVLENDLARRMGQDQLGALFTGSHQWVVLDHRMNETALKADLVLPAGTFAESQGTLVSAEARAQRVFPVYPGRDDIRASWEWLTDMIALHRGSSELPWEQFDDLMKACAETVDGLAGIVDAAPGADFRIGGMKIARQPHRYSGRTAMLADLNVSEPKQTQDSDSPLGFTMEGYPGAKPASLTPYHWAPGWNSNQVISKFQKEVNGPLTGGDPGVRLIEPALPVMAAWFEVAARSEARTDWLLLPAHHIFGSEELSSLAAAVAERIPTPYILLNPQDAAKLGVNNGQGVLLESGRDSLSLPVEIQAACPPGAVVVPAGYTATAGLAFMSGVNISRDPSGLIASDRGAQP